MIAYSKDFSEKALKNIRGVLSSFCLFLYDSDICYDLSTKNIKIPRSARKSVKNVLSPEGIYIVFSHDYMVKLAAPPVIIRGNFHLLTPFPWGVSRMILSVVRGLCWPWSADRLLFHLIFCRK